MANDLITFDTGGQRSAEFAFLDPNSENLGDGIGASYGIVGYRGKNWSLRYRGEQFYFTRPDDGTPLAVLNVIILSQARTKSKSYFQHWEEGSTEPPQCWSMDSVTPDTDVPQQQKGAATCALCPHNQWYPNPETGKKKRDCNDYKRIAVLLPMDHTKKMLGAELMEPAFLRVPAASLQALGMLGDQLQKQGYHFAEVVTQISFDHTVAYPKFIFKAIAKAPPHFAAIVKELRDDPVTGRIVGTTPQLAAPAPLVQLAAVPPAGTGFSTPAPQTLELQPNPPTGATTDAAGIMRMSDPKLNPTPAPASGNGAAAPAAPQPTAAAPPVSMTPAGTTPPMEPGLREKIMAHEAAKQAQQAPVNQDTGFGVVSAAAPVQQLANPTPPPADQGPATATDDAMDARIAALMPK